MSLLDEANDIIAAGSTPGDIKFTPTPTTTAFGQPQTTQGEMVRRIGELGRVSGAPGTRLRPSFVSLPGMQEEEFRRQEAVAAEPVIAGADVAAVLPSTVGRGALRGTAGLAGTVGQGLRAAGEVAEQPFGGDGDNFVTRLGVETSQFWEEAQQNRAIKRREEEEGLLGIIADASESIPGYAIAIASGIAGAPWIGAAVLGGQQGLGTYSEARDENERSVIHAAFAGTLDGILGYYLEKMPIDNLFANQAKSAIYRVLSGAGTESVQEGVQQFTSNLIKNVTGVDPDQELLEGVGRAMASAALLGGAGGAFVSGDANEAYNTAKETAASVAPRVEQALRDAGLETRYMLNVAPRGEGFYSPLRRTVETAQASNTGSGWMGFLGIKGDEISPRPGVSKAEYEASGVSDFLRQNANRRVTREELVAFIDQNSPKLGEVELSSRSAEEANRHRGGIYERDQTERRFGGSVRADEEFRRRQPKFSTYQLPGGENYREVFVTAPGENRVISPEDASRLLRSGNPVTAISKNLPETVYYELESVSDLQDYPSEDFLYSSGTDNRWSDGHSQYSDIPNPIVRLRTNERVDADGKRVLFIEEMQPPSPDNQERMPSWARNNWRELGIRKAIQMAVQGGFDRVAWTTGEQQADRYNLSNHIDSVWAAKNPDGRFNVWATKDGRNVMQITSADESQIADQVGKDLARNIIETATENGTEYTGVDLKVGGEGLSRIYDRDIPNVVNQILKTWGGRVGETRIATHNVDEADIADRFGMAPPQIESSQPSFDITPAMRQEIMERGEPMRGQKARFSTTQDIPSAVTEARVKELYPTGKVSTGQDGRIYVELPNGSIHVYGNTDKIEIVPSVVRADYGRDATPEEISRGAAGRTVVTDFGGIVEISKRGGDRTLLHETFEIAWDSLTAKEQAYLERKYGSREKAADAYADWRDGFKSERPSSTIGKLWQKIKDFFSDLTASRGFERIATGAVYDGERRPAVAPTHRDGIRYSIEQDMERARIEEGRSEKAIEKVDSLIKKLGLTAPVANRLRQMMFDSADKAGIDLDEVVSFEQIKGFANDLGIEESLERLKDGKQDRPTQAAFLAAKDHLASIQEKADELYATIKQNESSMTREELSWNQNLLAEYEQTADALVRAIMPFRTEAGRTLAYMRIHARRSFDEAYWQNRMARLADSTGIPVDHPSREKAQDGIREATRDGRIAEAEEQAAINDLVLQREALIDSVESLGILAAETDLAQAKSDYNAAKKQLDKIDRQIQKYNEQLFKKSIGIPERLEALKAAESALANEIYKLDKASNEYSEAKAQLDSVQRRIANLEGRTEVKRWQALGLKSNLADAREAYNQARKEWQSVRGKLQRAESRLSNTTAKTKVARTKLADALQTLSETGWLEMIGHLRRAGLLTGIGTTVRNVTGNTLWGLLRKATSLPSTMIDMAVGKATGRRAVSGHISNVKNLWSLMKYRAIPGAVDAWQTGGSRSDLEKYGASRKVNFQGLGEKAGRIINGYINGVYGFMSAQDKFFFEIALDGALLEVAKLKAINDGGPKGGPDFEARVAEYRNNPSPTDMAEATAIAEVSTFARSEYESINELTKKIGSLREGWRAKAAKGNIGAATAGLVMDIMFPFVKTPTNIGSIIVMHTPIGIALGAANGVNLFNKVKELNRNGEKLTKEQRAAREADIDQTQRAFAQMTSQGLVGSALLFLGAKLFDWDLIEPEEEDAGVREVMRADGRIPGHIRIPGTDYTFDIRGFSPVANMLLAGAYMQKDKHSAAVNWITVAIKTILDMPMSTGARDIIDAARFPSKAESVVGSIAGSFVPSLVSDIARASDMRQRVSAGPGGELPGIGGAVEKAAYGIMSRTPGLRSTLQENMDVFGRPLYSAPPIFSFDQGFNKEGFFGYAQWLLSGTKRGNDPVAKELLRLGVGVGKPRRDTEGGETRLSVFERMKEAGPSIYSAIAETITSTEKHEFRPKGGDRVFVTYAEATDEQKAKILERAITEGRRDARQPVTPVVRGQSTLLSDIDSILSGGSVHPSVAQPEAPMGGSSLLDEANSIIGEAR